MYIEKNIYIYMINPPERPHLSRTRMYTYYCFETIFVYIYDYIFLVPPRSNSFVHGIYNMQCTFSLTQFHYSFSSTFKLQIFQNREKHSIFVYKFRKTSEKSPVFCFFYYVFTTPKQEQCVNMKPIVLHIAFA